MADTDYIVWNDTIHVAAGMLQSLICHGERAEVYGKVSGRESLWRGSGLKSGVWWLREAIVWCAEVGLGALDRKGFVEWLEELI